MISGNVDFSQLLQLRDNIQKLKDQQMPQFCEDTVKELAARLLSKTVKRTPVDTGELRRNWRVGSVKRVGTNYEIEIINQTEYAEYVEYGHRTPSHTKWVKGKFMLTISEKELNTQADAIIQAKLEKFLGGVFK